MQWIRTGRQIGQAVKNVQRLRQILGVMAKHGFVDVVDRMNLGKLLPSRLAAFAASQSELGQATRLRIAFEELGPTFVKLGQLLSTRTDLLPDEFIEEFTRLQDNVQPLPFEVVKQVVERELGKTIDAAFASFSEKPLAAASIAQVHEAALHTGEKVVVKVQRPELEKIIENDISLLVFLAGLLEKYVPETRVIGPRTIVDEFFRTLSQETDFVIEANNMVKTAENMALIPEIVIPRVYKSHSTHRVLTQERLEGIRVNDLRAIDAAGIDRKYVVGVGARAFFRSVLIDGLFHGDLHGGNLFVLPGNRLGIIDFGIVGRLSEKSRDRLAGMMMSLLTEDYENLCYQYVELSTSSSAIDFDAFQREVRNTLSPYMGLPLNEINVGRVLIEATKIATQYNIQIPGDWMLVFKAILTVEGLGRTLDPTFDLLATGRELAKELIKNQYSPQRMTRDLMVVARDMSLLLETLPRQIRWMFRKLARNDYAIEVRSPELADIRRQMDLNGRRMSLSILVGGLFIAGSIALHRDGGAKLWDTPYFSVLLFGGGCFFLIRLFLRSFK